MQQGAQPFSLWPSCLQFGCLPTRLRLHFAFSFLNYDHHVPTISYHRRCRTHRRTRSARVDRRGKAALHKTAGRHSRLCGAGTGARYHRCSCHRTRERLAANRTRRRAASVVGGRGCARERARCRAGRRPVSRAPGHRRMNLLDATATTLRSDIAAGRVSAVESCRAALDRIAAVDPSLNAFNLVDAERALARAQQIDQRRAAGETLGPLAGVPIAIKDNMNVRGMLTTASSTDPRDFIPPYDATVVRHLEAAGAVIVGKDELRRVRNGIVERELGIRSRAQSMGARSHPGRIERRFRGRGRGSVRAARARLRYRRVDPSAGRVLRRGRAEAVLRPRVAVRPARLRVVAGSDRPVRAHRGGCGNRLVGAAPARIPAMRQPRANRCPTSPAH